MLIKEKESLRLELNNMKDKNVTLNKEIEDLKKEREFLISFKNKIDELQINENAKKR